MQGEKRKADEREQRAKDFLNRKTKRMDVE